MLSKATVMKTSCLASIFPLIIPLSCAKLLSYMKKRWENLLSVSLIFMTSLITLCTE